MRYVGDYLTFQYLYTWVELIQRLFGEFKSPHCVKGKHKSVLFINSNRLQNSIRYNLVIPSKRPTAIKYLYYIGLTNLSYLNESNHPDGLSSFFRGCPLKVWQTPESVGAWWSFQVMWFIVVLLFSSPVWNDGTLDIYKCQKEECCRSPVNHFHSPEMSQISFNIKLIKKFTFKVFSLQKRISL